jgi:hypothetical protein
VDDAELAVLSCRSATGLTFGIVTAPPGIGAAGWSGGYVQGRGGWPGGH